MKVWTVDEVCRLLGVSKNWLYKNWRAVGLEKIQGLRHLRFTDNSVMKLIGHSQ